MGAMGNSVDFKQAGVRMKMRQTATGGAKAMFTFGNYDPVEVIIPANAVDKGVLVFELAAKALRVWGHDG